MNLRTLLISGLVGLISASAAVFAQTPGVNNNFAVVWTMVWEATTTKPSYSVFGQGTPASAATDVCTLAGSATKTMRVRRIILNGIASAAQSDPVMILRRSTADTGGGFALYGGTYDTNNAAGTEALAEFWTTNPTLGTLASEIADPMLNWGNLTTGLGTQLSYEFNLGGASSLVLRGVAQSVSVNLNGLTYTTPTLNCTFVWTEE